MSLVRARGPQQEAVFFCIPVRRDGTGAYLFVIAEVLGKEVLHQRWEALGSAWSRRGEFKASLCGAPPIMGVQVGLGFCRGEYPASITGGES
jgi:hypothetical protein